MRRTFISLTAISALFLGATAFAQDAMMQNSNPTEDRLNALESALEQLTGDFEQQKFLMQQLNKKVESLEKQKLSAVAPQPTPAPVDAQPAATDTPLPSDAPAAQSSSEAGDLASGTAEEAYNAAFAKLKRADYKGAATDFTAFLKKYPDNALAGNAQYWLGETYYVRKDFNNAAAEFLKGYKKFPKNTKAPDTLLKLGMSLNALGNKEQACKAFARLPSDYPTAAPALKTRAEQEKTKLACQ
jgi:tol-pal system protein YbgF